MYGLETRKALILDESVKEKRDMRKEREKCVYF